MKKLTELHQNFMKSRSELDEAYSKYVEEIKVKVETYDEEESANFIKLLERLFISIPFKQTNHDVPIKEHLVVTQILLKSLQLTNNTKAKILFTNFIVPSKDFLTPSYFLEALQELYENVVGVSE